MADTEVDNTSSWCLKCIVSLTPLPTVVVVVFLRGVGGGGLLLKIVNSAFICASILPAEAAIFLRDHKPRERL